MAPTTALDRATIDRVAAAVEAEPTLLAALAADLAGVARTRLGIEVPAGLTLTVGPDGGTFGVRGEYYYSFPLSQELRDAAFGDELPDHALDAVAGGGGPTGPSRDKES